MKTLVFDLALGEKDKAIRDASRIFKRAGAAVVSSSVDPGLSRRAGVSYRNINFTFADGQAVTFGVKLTGDVFEVRLNGKVVPLRNQDDHAEAIGEIADRMDSAGGAFQRALAKVRIPVPASITVSRTTMVASLTEKRDNLRTAVTEARAVLAKMLPAGAPV